MIPKHSTDKTGSNALHWSIVTSSLKSILLVWIVGLMQSSIIGGGAVFIHSCSALLISFEMHCFYGLWTWIYKYAPSLKLSTWLRHWSDEDSVDSVTEEFIGFLDQKWLRGPKHRVRPGPKWIFHFSYFSCGNTLSITQTRWRPSGKKNWKDDKKQDCWNWSERNKNGPSKQGLKKILNFCSQHLQWKKQR